ncbi:hypothetical protein MIMGU_mgv1a016726mg [Erythranthe guttata]|uniref:Uncharacterized protein n=1 Tax=Erythranthe guttata TaxID=4155 RepID=A0A022QBK3_ERYGU|nr:hypothetical protein MIMGU_mgv1a016726mg [Erythranthe guttata]
MPPERRLFPRLRWIKLVDFPRLGIVPVNRFPSSSNLSSLTRLTIFLGIGPDNLLSEMTIVVIFGIAKRKSGKGPVKFPRWANLRDSKEWSFESEGEMGPARMFVPSEGQP